MDAALLSAFAYIGPFWFVGLISDKKDDPFLQYHVNQGLVLFIFEMVAGLAAWIISKVFESVPMLGQIVSVLLCIAVCSVSLIMSVKGALNASAGKTVPLPLIGGISLIQGGRIKR